MHVGGKLAPGHVSLAYTTEGPRALRFWLARLYTSQVQDLPRRPEERRWGYISQISEPRSRRLGW